MKTLAMMAFSICCFVSFSGCSGRLEPLAPLAGGIAPNGPYGCRAEIFSGMVKVDWIVDRNFQDEGYLVQDNYLRYWPATAHNQMKTDLKYFPEAGPYSFRAIGLVRTDSGFEWTSFSNWSNPIQLPPKKETRNQ